MNKANAYGRLGGETNLREAVRLYDHASSVLTALFGSEHRHVRVVIHNRAIAPLVSWQPRRKRRIPNVER
jgi:hypothetical protein